MSVIIYICIVLGVYFIFSSLFPPEGRKNINISGSFGMKSHKKAYYFFGNVLDTLGRINAPLFRIGKFSSHYSKLVNRGGLNLSPFGFFALKEAAAVLFFVISIFLNFSTKVNIAAVIFGFFLPDLWISRKIKAYQEKILRVLPETIDLLSLCVSAGLDFMGAVKWITESRVRFKTPFMDELVRVREEIRLGRAKAQALTDMEARLNIPEISSLVRTLVFSETLGVTVSEALDNFSQENRERRFHRGERQARMAGIKVLFPLIFFILPVIGIIIIGPVLLQFMQQGFMKM